MTQIEYRIDSVDTAAFLAALTKLSHERRRGGAFAWGVFEDAAEPGRYIEYFMETSWLEHLSHHQRVTKADREIQEKVQAFHRGKEGPRVNHFLVPHGESPRD
jgi:hypothetical protein